ncbi:hypothetical protein H5P28_07050 [Ruficoccus amylovorans]|uniref:Uncharacterized protein n=1 Tax=Ruficoccus amylovorans TaxID=1804625 RepID=A0A842HED4_9BACT|nr:hypothetical protein [Ruficoccus amylovorans]MBC2594016.1 hypothetical protein [Ruficoccus amylovorans]
MTAEELRVVLNEYIGMTWVWRGFVAGFVLGVFPAFFGWVRSIWNDVDD